MTYNKQHFTDGQVLSASQLNAIEQGIVDNENAIAQKQDKGDYVTKTEANNAYASKENTYTKTEVDNKIANAGSGGSGIDLGEYLKKTEASQAYQEKLVSGTNLKTINGKSLLGSGNVSTQGATPTEKGMVGKVISVLGDSISTFKGYIPDADGFNEKHETAYPAGSVNTVDKTWWHILITSYNAKLGINDSWSGSRVSNYSQEANIGGGVGTKVAMASITRISNLGSNGTPDLILFYGGTNDGKFSTFNELDLTQVYSEVDLDSVTWTSFETAYKDAIMRLQHYYPKATIVAITPTFVSSWYTNARLHEMDEHIKKICDYFGVICIDLRKCGITYQNLMTYLGDGLHPNAEGMKLIANFIKGELEGKLVMDEGENVVYKVTNTLSTLTTSAPHIVGVSNGATYTATLSGSTTFDGVQVFMGGKDVTSTALVNGVVTISSVTGDIVVTDGEYTPPEDIEVTSISNATGSTSYSLNKGDTVQLAVSYSPSNTTQKGVTWSSSASAVASVSQSGLVTCVASGSTTITATSTYNSSIKASWTIAVAEDVGGGDDETGGDVVLPTEETWYVDFTSEEVNYAIAKSVGGVAFEKEETYSKCVGVPINAVKLIVGGNGTMGYGKVAPDGDTYTSLGVITLSGATSTDSEAVAQIFKLNETITLAEGERFAVMEYGNKTTGKLWIYNTVTESEASVRSDIRSTGASKNAKWHLTIGIGYVV